jgi:N-acetylneuraminic acid mutarotase
MISLKSASLVLLSLLGASGCGGGSSQADGSSSNEKVNINGAVEKGPFIVGSTVTINMLSELGENTGFTIVTNTTDDLGSFRFSVEADKLLQITSTGYYRNEITGELSTGILTLRSIYKATIESDQHAYVNLLTHLTSNRVLYLIRNLGISYEQAVQQTETEFLSAFERVIASSPDSNFSSFSIYESQGSSGSGYLLAVSSVIYQYAIDRSNTNATNPGAELALLINEIEEDFGADGVIDDENKIELLRRTHTEINPQEVMSNVQNWINDVDGYSVPDLNEYLDSDLDGIVNADDTDDDNDGIEDGKDNSPYTADFNVSGQNISTNEDVGVTIDISSNNPLGEEINVDIVNEPVNGTLAGSYPEINYVPNENYSGVDYFSYVLSQRDLTSPVVNINILISPINDAPIISGTPANSIKAGNEYTFTPSLLNIEGDSLIYSIENAPDWASFDVNTGTLIGTPINEDSGDYENILINVSDGNLSSSIEPFTISVSSNPWEQMTRMPTGRHSPSAAAIDGLIFVTGGFNGGIKSDLEIFDTTTNTWETKASMNTPRYSHGSFVVDSEIYVVGGNVTSVESYNVDSNIWTQKSSSNNAVAYSPTSCLYNGKIYLFGSGSANNIVEMYDPISDTWSNKSTMKVGNWGMACVTINDLIYVIGGRYNETGYDVYNPVIDDWEDSGVLNSPKRYGFSASAVNEKIYVIGGYECLGSCSSLNVVERFDPIQLEWNVLSSMPENRHNIGYATVNDSIYIFGGRDDSSNNVDKVEVYTYSFDQH